MVRPHGATGDRPDGLQGLAVDLGQTEAANPPIYNSTDIVSGNLEGGIVESQLKCRKFEVFSKPVTAVDGSPRQYDVVVHPGAVVVLPLLDGGLRVAMIRQYRWAIDRELWELPAGTLDVPGEAPAAAALRELEEETGYRAERIEPLCSFFSSPGIMTERIHAFVADGLTKTAQKLGPTERIRVEIVSTDEAFEMVRDGRIDDAKTIVALLRWQMRERAR